MLRKHKDTEGRPCPNTECGSSDGLKPHKDGWLHCFSCGSNFKEDNITDVIDAPLAKVKPPSNFTGAPEVYRNRPERGLLADTAKRYKVDVGKDGANYYSKHPLVTVDDEHVGNKVRKSSSKAAAEGPPFIVEGNVENRKLGLYGRHAFPKGCAKIITVTEGYEDAEAAFQMMGSKYPCVSVHSSATAERDVKNDFEYLNSFDTIVFAFDNDEPGIRAAKACAGAGFPLGKVKILTHRKHKDANEYLKAREGDLYTKEWWQAPAFKPDGLLLGSDDTLWKAIIERQEHFTVQYPWTGLNKLTYGLRTSELVVVTADTGVGKTSVLKHIEHLLLTDPTVKEKNYGVGFLHLEEPNGDTALGLLSIHNRAPYHLPDTERPEADIRKAYDEVLNNDRVVIWDHFGSNSVDAVLAKVRHMAALGCRYIVLDHLSIIVSDQAGDERKQLDEITTKLKTLTMELDLAVIAVIHTNRQGQIRGTAGVEQLANIVVRLERDKTDQNEWRRNVTKITVEKNRFCGYTGPACYLWYNRDTARLQELEDEEALTYENGGQLGDDQAW